MFAEPVVGERVSAEEVLQLEAVDDDPTAIRSRSPPTKTFSRNGRCSPALAQQESRGERQRAQSSSAAAPPGMASATAAASGHRECGE